jgi:hypothetical protein
MGTDRVGANVHRMCPVAVRVHASGTAALDAAQRKIIEPIWTKRPSTIVTSNIDLVRLFSDL